MSTNGYDSEHVIAAVYTGPGDPIQINRVRQFTWPIDLILPGGETLSIFEAPVLEGRPAILYYPKPGSLLGSDRTVLSFVEGDAETTVMGDHLARDNAVRIGLSLICGASCAASQAAVPPVEPIIRGTSPPESAGVGDSDFAGAESAGTSEPAPSSFVGDEHRVIEGLQITRAMVTSWWDHPPPSEYPLDLQHPNGSDASANLPVNFASWPSSGNGKMYVTTEEYRHDPSYCDGRYLLLKDAGGNELGRLLYVHLQGETQIGTQVTWPTNAGTWTIRNLGYVAVSQVSGCPWSPDGKHLHQGQTVASPRIEHNTALPQPNGIIDPTNDPNNNWMHKVTLIDSDGDACSDQEELGPNKALGGQRNPHNYCDFYDITNLTMVIAAKDKAVSGFDLNILLYYMNSFAGDRGLYDGDTNHNGTPDGNEMDFSGLYSIWPNSGPDGAISGWDLNDLLTQLNDSCVAPP